MNILIPMAGNGRRFVEKGYLLPKPLIDVFGQPMVQRVIENIGLTGHYIFIIQKKHQEQLTPILKSSKPDCTIIAIDYVTEGAACTCLLAKEYVNNDDHLVIANCDQIMDWNSQEFANLIKSDIDACILTFTSQSPNNSYARVNRHGIVTRVAEKQVISDIATTGVYHWSKGKYMVESCEKMIAANKRWNNELYLCPSYNEMIEDGLIVVIHQVKAHHPIGTPEELERYLHGSV
jgi:dTDP-glucose pyrophosphorylase